MYVLLTLVGDVLDQLSDKVSVVERLEMTPFQRQVYIYLDIHIHTYIL